MDREKIKSIIEKQRAYFMTGATLTVKFRKEALVKLKAAIREKETEIAEAIRSDLGKSRDEAYMCEIGLTLSEITYMEKHLNRFAKEKRVMSPLPQFVFSLPEVKR